VDRHKRLDARMEGMLPTNTELAPRKVTGISMLISKLIYAAIYELTQKLLSAIIEMATRIGLSALGDTASRYPRFRLHVYIYLTNSHFHGTEVSRQKIVGKGKEIVLSRW
jgi:hypothetical protein